MHNDDIGGTNSSTKEEYMNAVSLSHYQKKKMHMRSSRCPLSRRWFWLGNTCDVDFRPE